MSRSHFETIPLPDLPDQVGGVVDRVTRTGVPVFIDRDGREVAAIVPAAVLRAGGFPPAYFDEEQRQRDIAEIEARLHRSPPEDVAKAMAWAQRIVAACEASTAVPPAVE